MCDLLLSRNVVVVSSLTDFEGARSVRIHQISEESAWCFSKTGSEILKQNHIDLCAPLRAYNVHFSLQFIVLLLQKR